MTDRILSAALIIALAIGLALLLGLMIAPGVTSYDPTVTPPPNPPTVTPDGWTAPEPYPGPGQVYGSAGQHTYLPVVSK